MSKKHKSKRISSAAPLVPPDRILYWAYGSNLCVRQMKRRCPDAVKYGPMTVSDCALIFRHVADVTMREGTKTPGGLWTITANCERSLDAYEGVAQKMYLKRYLQLKLDDSERRYTCLFYQMRTKEGIMPPSEQYLDTIVRGYMDFNLDTEALEQALAESWGDKAPTEDLLDRHERRGSPRLARTIIDPDEREQERGLRQRQPMWDDDTQTVRRIK